MEGRVCRVRRGDGVKTLSKSFVIVIVIVILILILVFLSSLLFSSLPVPTSTPISIIPPPRKPNAYGALIIESCHTSSQGGVRKHAHPTHARPAPHDPSLPNKPNNDNNKQTVKKKRQTPYAKYPNSSPSSRSRYSFSSKISMHFLISGTLGVKRDLICWIVSCTSWTCFIFLRDFMIRTIADCVSHVS